MIKIGKGIAIPENEIEINPIRAQGAGGQNVNKVESAVHLRFDIPASSLPDSIKQRLLAMPDNRISGEGVVVIKGQQHRTRERNREDAIKRLKQLIARAAEPRKKRIPTKPGKNAKRRRLDEKKKHGQRKKMRGPVGGAE